MECAVCIGWVLLFPSDPGGSGRAVAPRGVSSPPCADLRWPEETKRLEPVSSGSLRSLGVVLSPQGALCRRLGRAGSHKYTVQGLPGGLGAPSRKPLPGTCTARSSSITHRGCWACPPSLSASQEPLGAPRWAKTLHTGGPPLCASAYVRVCVCVRA